MALVEINGFETGDASEAISATGTFEIQSTIKRTGAYALRIHPASGATGAYVLGVPGANGRIAAISIANAFLSFQFRPETLPAAGNFHEELARMTIGGIVNIAIRINSDGNLYLFDGTTQLDVDNSGLTIGNTYLIEFNCNDTANTQEVRLNGVVVLNGTVATSGNVNSILLGKATDRNGNAVDFYYDDVALDDAAYPGAGECRIAVPIGAGAASGWTAGTGADNFAEADEIPHDSDTTYIGALATEDNLDHTFNMQTFSTIGAGGAIGAVKTIVIARTDSTGGSSSVAHRRLFNGSGFELTALELLTTYQALSQVDATDPSAGGGAITEADFDSIEVGMAANSIAQVQRFTVAYLTVWSAGAVAATRPAEPNMVAQMAAQGNW